MHEVADHLAGELHENWGIDLEFEKGAGSVKIVYFGDDFVVDDDDLVPDEAEATSFHEHINYALELIEHYENGTLPNDDN